MKKFLILIIILFISNKLVAENITDQWSDSDFTYKDLIDSGFEVKAYDTSTLEVANGMTIMFFVTVLQKDKEVYGLPTMHEVRPSIEKKSKHYSEVLSEEVINKYKNMDFWNR